MAKLGHMAGVMLSGGQDSATCLAWALQNFDEVETIGFTYGQRHHIEMECRETVRTQVHALMGGTLGEDHLVDLSALGQMSETSLTRDVEIEISETGLPTTFVPGRNLIFLNFAAALGWRRGFSDIVGGMCEADFSGYPDCRKDTLDAQMTAISLGLDKPFSLHTPLMHLSKAGAWGLAEDMGGRDLVEIVRTQTHTCYTGEHDVLHSWGYGCGSCPACEIRAQGWSEYCQAPETSS